jgi:hypothetical protein
VANVSALFYQIISQDLGVYLSMYYFSMMNLSNGVIENYTTHDSISFDKNSVVLSWQWHATHAQQQMKQFNG